MIKIRINILRVPRLFCMGLLLLVLGSCKAQPNQSIPNNTAINEKIKFSYQEAKGIGEDEIYNRRDNSDVIKVGDTYYVWYSRMDSPVTSGYWATIWYATSKDEGHTWQEQGLALGLGEKGTFDSHSVFTPNVLEFNGKYYMYYTAVKPTPGNAKEEFEGNHTTDFTAIGLAVSDGPDGPFKRVANNPVLKNSDTSDDFDSYRIDDASILVKDNKIWLYYKGRSMKYGAKGPSFTQMGVAFADQPEGPYVKNSKPILDKSHEVLIWKNKKGVFSLASINHSISIAKDGLNFQPVYTNLDNIPKAPGLYRPSLVNEKSNDDLPIWGIAMKQEGKKAFLVRYEISKE